MRCQVDAMPGVAQGADKAQPNAAANLLLALLYLSLHGYLCISPLYQLIVSHGDSCVLLIHLLL